MNNKIIIVGHGLAGAILAHTLIEHKQDVLVLDSQMPHSATKVSAGLINPFIGPKLNVPEDFSVCMLENNNFFQKIEQKTGKNYLKSIILHRVFQSDQQKEKWEYLSEDYKRGFLSKKQCKEIGIETTLGAGQTSAWKLNALDFIKDSQEALIFQKRYLAESFNPKKWGKNRVIFCEGYRVRENKWFMHLPFSPAQGEILQVESTNNLNVSNGIWYITDDNKTSARIGSTWKHQDIESGPTIPARKEIIGKVSYFPELSKVRVLSHVSGVRSATSDRQPILGQHPEFKNYYLFNGFGSRGSTTISRCAKQMTDFILKGQNLPIQNDIRRFA